MREYLMLNNIEEQMGEDGWCSMAYRTVAGGYGEVKVVKVDKDTVLMGFTEQSREIERIHERIYTDSLALVKSRRYYDECLATQRCRALVMADIDNYMALGEGRILQQLNRMGLLLIEHNVCVGYVLPYALDTVLAVVHTGITFADDDALPIFCKQAKLELASLVNVDLKLWAFEWFEAFARLILYSCCGRTYLYAANAALAARECFIHLRGSDYLVVYRPQIEAIPTFVLPNDKDPHGSLLGFHQTLPVET